jgi:hypothetical protein
LDLVVQAYLYDPPDATGPPVELTKRQLSNKLKQIGLSFKMFANEDRRGMFPPLSTRYGAFYPELNTVYPEYMPDASMLPLLRGDDDTRFVYFGYAIDEPVQAQAFLDQYETVGPDQVGGGDLKVDEGVGLSGSNMIIRLREGVERFIITDINNPNAAAKAQATLPVMWQLPTAETGGGYVLYLDGHTEWVEYPGKYPMEPGVIERVRGIMDSATPAQTL